MSVQSEIQIEYEAAPAGQPAELTAPRVSVIIVAAGSGTRMDGIHKQFVLLGGIPAVIRSMLAFQPLGCVSEIVAVCRVGEEEDFRRMARQYAVTKLTAVVPGGANRTLSVSAGVEALQKPSALIAIHDGARPLLQPETVEETVLAAIQTGAAAPALPLKDTVKAVNEDEIIIGSPPRFNLRAVQTPQIFKRDIYITALQSALKDGFSDTDDCGIISHYCPAQSVELVRGDVTNIKITAPEDLLIAEAFLKKGSDRDMRVGQGYDVHRFEIGRRLVLGGVTVPFDRGLAGHSDADVLTHAVMDALLGAAGLCDIGHHFPDTDEQYRGADSLALLEKVALLLSDRGYRACNIDATVVAQQPKLAPYVSEMRENLAARLGLRAQDVNVKATTEEGLGFTGRQEGVASYAVCTIEAF